VSGREPADAGGRDKAAGRVNGGGNGDGEDVAGGRIDNTDTGLLDILRDCYSQLDPMPHTLVERSLFALAWAADPADAGVELLRIAGQRELEAVGARGEEARVITFETESVTVMIRISAEGELLRIDGWLAPPGVRRVELRTATCTVTALADEQGRFVLERVRQGLAQLAVHRHGDEEEPAGDWPDGTVLTPAIML
jgi:hypothetical protein